MVASPQAPASARSCLKITWEKLPDDYVLPDDPVDNLYQPMLAEALRDGLREIGLASDQTLMPTNYGITTRVNDKVVVKAPDWSYIPQINTPLANVERSYTPVLQGDLPVIVMEFLSETDGGEYSSKQTHPYGKWFFYEQILQVPHYVIFDIDGGLLEFYRLEGAQYKLEQPNPDGRHWVEAMGLFLGTWQGRRDERTGYWLRWWTDQGVLVPWVRERALQEQARADQEQARADQEQARADRLAEYLRSQGIDPNVI
ncbi:MAG: hypothetical protein HC857_04685 [Synechococcales cyanobacterium RU_4_20]|nr:hypothetical protein [Synechococcales cyanobacterium RU_4_20]NJR70368.1 hypothetical protein [Synechococcales cyanobacterium CRU_2_2]